MGRQRPNLDTTSEDVEIQSFGDGTSQSLFIDLPANGRFDITIEAVSDISDVTIVANWVYSDFLEPIINEPIVEPKADNSCRDIADQMMKSTDVDSNGLIDNDELTSIVGISSRDTFNLDNINDAIEKIRTEYQKIGRHLAEVKSTKVDLGEGRVNLNFDIKDKNKKELDKNMS